MANNLKTRREIPSALLVGYGIITYTDNVVGAAWQCESKSPKRRNQSVYSAS